MNLQINNIKSTGFQSECFIYQGYGFNSDQLSVGDVGINCHCSILLSLFPPLRMFYKLTCIFPKSTFKIMTYFSLHLYTHTPCSDCTMLLLCMFSRLMPWFCIANWCVLSQGSLFLPLSRFLCCLQFLCRVEAQWPYPSPC